MKIVTTLAAIGCALAVSSTSVNAQSSFEKFEKLDQAASTEVEKFRAVLNGDDPGRRLRAMRYMLQSKNPQLIREAKDFGLFSTDKVLQSEALRALFDQGGPFRLVVDITSADQEKTGIITYFNNLKGGFNAERTRMYYTFRTEAYNSKSGCWFFKGSTSCALYLVGTSVSLKDWRNGAGSLTLNDAGQLIGTLRYTSRSHYQPVPAGISLIE